MLTTDMNGLGPDGKPTGQAATFTGASKAGATAASASSKMQLTADEQAVLDGKEGPEKAKLMKILVRFGETFGATKLVDLGGAETNSEMAIEMLGLDPADPRGFTLTGGLPYAGGPGNSYSFRFITSTVRWVSPSLQVLTVWR